MPQRENNDKQRISAAAALGMVLLSVMAAYRVLRTPAAASGPIEALAPASAGWGVDIPQVRQAASVDQAVRMEIDFVAAPV